MAAFASSSRTLAVGGALVLLAGLAFLALQDRRESAPVGPAEQAPPFSADAELRGASARAASAPASETSAPAAEATSVELHVRMADGTPATRALVRLCSAAATRAAGIAADLCVVGRTSGEGVCTLEVPRLLRGQPLQASAESEDGSEAARAAVRVTTGGSVEIRMGRSARIEGQVLGLGVGETATVLAYSPAWAEAPQSRAIPVAEDGTFSIPGAPHRLNLLARVPDRVPSEFWTGTPKAGELVRVVLTLGGEAATAQLTVLRPDGTPVPLGRPLLYRSGDRAWLGGTTDDEGRVRCSGLASDAALELFVPAIQDDIVKSWESVDHHASISPSLWRAGGVRVQLPGACNSSFELRDLRGEPIAHLPLWLVPQSDAASGTAIAAKAGLSDELGVWLPYERHAVPAGPFRLVSVGRRLLWSGVLTTGDRNRIPVTLSSLQPLRLRLLDGASRAIRSKFISIAAVRDDDRSDPETWRPVTPGAVTFELHSDMTLLLPTDEMSTSRIRIRELHGESRDVPLPPVGGVLEVRPSPSSGSLRVRVFDEGGGSVPGAFVLLTAQDGARAITYAARMDADGRAELHGLRPGEYRPTIATEDMSSPLAGFANVQIRSGSVAEAELRQSVSR